MGVECVCVDVFLQEGKREAFYTLRPTPTPPLQPLPLNGGSQFKDCNPTKTSWLQVQDVMAQVNGR
jgi:hypothetical protein